MSDLRYIHTIRSRAWCGALVLALARNPLLEYYLRVQARRAVSLILGLALLCVSFAVDHEVIPQACTLCFTDQCRLISSIFPQQSRPAGIFARAGTDRAACSRLLDSRWHNHERQRPVHHGLNDRHGSTFQLRCTVYVNGVCVRLCRSEDRQIRVVLRRHLFLAVSSRALSPPHR